jgi:hypothetical protein
LGLRYYADSNSGQQERRVNGLEEGKLVDGGSGEVRSGFSNAVIARQPLEPELKATADHDVGARANGAN